MPNFFFFYLGSTTGSREKIKEDQKIDMEKKEKKTQVLLCAPQDGRNPADNIYVKFKDGKVATGGFVPEGAEFGPPPGIPLGRGTPGGGGTPAGRPPAGRGFSGSGGRGGGGVGVM